jgi:hypothetical protein
MRHSKNDVDQNYYRSSDTISKQLYDALLAYLIQSSTALDGTIKALATGALVSPLALNGASDSAKVLLSKVIHALILIQISSPVYCTRKIREENLAGSTEETMRSL